MQNKVAIDIASFLKIKSGDIDKFIKVAIGDKIEVDTVLAEKKSFMGVNSTKVLSPIAGVVDSFDFREGQIVLLVDSNQAIKQSSNQERKEISDEAIERSSNQAIKQSSNQEKKENSDQAIEQSSNQVIKRFGREKKEELDSLKQNEDEKIEIKNKEKKKEKIEDNELESLFSFGQFSGEGIWMEELIVGDLNFTYKGKIIICNRMPTLEMFYKASVLGIKGFITNSYKLKKAKKIADEIEGKFEVGLLVLADKYEIEELGGREVEVVGGKLKVE